MVGLIHAWWLVGGAFLAGAIVGWSLYWFVNACQEMAQDSTWWS